jgi:hypothetical protein
MDAIWIPAMRGSVQGYHEKKKDKFNNFHHVWNYSVRGKTVDRRELRVIVSFDENGMLIITAIELKKRD